MKNYEVTHSRKSAGGGTKLATKLWKEDAIK